MSDQLKIGDIVTKPVLEMMPRDFRWPRRPSMVLKHHWHCITCDVPILSNVPCCPICGARQPETV